MLQAKQSRPLPAALGPAEKARETGRIGSYNRPWCNKLGGRAIGLLT